MLRTLKRVFVVLSIFCATVFALLAYLVFGFDPNTLKPHIYQLAQERGLELQIEGDIHWQLYPNLALNIANVSARDPLQKSPKTQTHDSGLLFATESAHLAVALKPLINRQVQVDGVSFTGLKLNYYRDAEGNSNWDSLKAETTPATEDTQQSEPSGSLDISLAEITITDAELTVFDAYQAEAQALEIALRIDSSTISNITSAAQDIHMQLIGEITNAELPTLSYRIDAKLSAIFDDKRSAKSQDPSLAGIDLDTLNLTLTQKKSERSLEIHNQARIHFEPFNMQGQATIKADHMGAWLNEMLSSPVEALSLVDNTEVSANYIYDAEIGASGQIKAKLTSHSLSQAKETQQSLLTGEFTATDLAKQPEYVAKLQLDKLNADFFIDKAQNASTEVTSPESDTPLPLELIRSLKLAFELKIGKLHYQALDLNAVTVSVDAKKARLSLESHGQIIAEQQAKASTYTLTAHYDAKNSPGNMQLNAEAKALDSQALLKSFIELDSISGLIDTQVEATSQGDSVNTLIEALKARAELQSPQFKLQPVNIAKLYCDALSLIDGSLEDSLKAKLADALKDDDSTESSANTDTKDWPKFTLTKPATLIAEYHNGLITLQQLSTAIEQLSAQAVGTYTVATGQFHVPISLSLEQMTEGISHCGVTDSKWLKQKLPLVCKGSIESAGIGSCNLDSSYIKERADTAIEREKQKRIDKAEQQLEKEATKQLEKYLDKEKVDKLKELFK